MLRLEVLEATGRRAVAMDTSPFHIGRSSENQLQISDTQASRHHAELREEADGWHVRDCGSRFGTFLERSENRRRTNPSGGRRSARCSGADRD